MPTAIPRSASRPFSTPRILALERSRANFDLTHMIKAFGNVELPFGKGYRLSYHPIDRVIGGWRLARDHGVAVGRAVLDHVGTRDAESHVAVVLQHGEHVVDGIAARQVVKFQMTGIGPRIIASSAVNPADFTGVNADGEKPFTGQVFFNPEPGTVGGLQRRYFSGPWTFGLDMSLQKNVKITEIVNLEFRADAFNVLNHPTFWSGDQNINSPGFGLIGYTLTPPRIMQFGLTLSF